MKLIALNAQDILRDVDPASSDRAYSCAPHLVTFAPDTATADFNVQCANSRNSWEVRVQLIDFNYVVPEDERELIMGWDDIVQEYPELLTGDILLHCTCPAFQWWGSHYTLHQLDTALSPEDRYPHIRDPNLERVACKHVIAVLRNFF